jgi:hypothetical protein
MMTLILLLIAIWLFVSAVRGILDCRSQQLFLREQAARARRPNNWKAAEDRLHSEHDANRAMGSKP